MPTGCARNARSQPNLIQRIEESRIAQAVPARANEPVGTSGCAPATRPLVPACWEAEKAVRNSGAGVADAGVGAGALVRDRAARPAPRLRLGCGAGGTDAVRSRRQASRSRPMAYCCWRRGGCPSRAGRRRASASACEPPNRLPIRPAIVVGARAGYAFLRLRRRCGHRHTGEHGGLSGASTAG